MKDFVKITNLPDFSPRLGCFVEGDKHVHFGEVGGLTVCGLANIKEYIFSREVTVTCPDCIAEFKHRGEHPEHAKRPFGIVTCKGE